jgi:phage gp45-like
MSSSPTISSSGAQALVQERALPSGKTVVVRADGRTEEIEVRSSTGALEIRIVLTDQGPVLTLCGARLEINATDTVAVNCKHFAVRAAEGVVLDAAGDIALVSGQETRLRSAGDTFIDGKLLKLNCQDRTGYADAQGSIAAPAQPEEQP